MRIRIFIFIGIALAILLLLNAVIFNATILLFHITAGVELLSLGIILGTLSVGFIFASILGSYFYNWFTRMYYTISAVSVGSMFYFFIASVIYSLVAAFGGQISDTTGFLLFACAAVVSAYGAYNAGHIRIVNESVILPVPSEAWRGRKAVWVSDIHLGQVHGRAYLLDIVERINDLLPDIVFIGGDLFDGTKAPDLTAMVVPLKKFMHHWECILSLAIMKNSEMILRLSPQ